MFHSNVEIGAGLKGSSQTLAGRWLDLFHSIYSPFLNVSIHLIEQKVACVTSTQVRAWT